MSDYRFLLKLYGVRGSYPNPSEKNTKYGGNTTCIMARTKSHIVFFDAGSGLIQAGKDLVPEIIAHKKRSNDPLLDTSTCGSVRDMDCRQRRFMTECAKDS